MLLYALRTDYMLVFPHYMLAYSEESRRKNRYSKLYQASRIIGRYTFQVDPSHCLAFAVVTYGTEQDDRPWG